MNERLVLCALAGWLAVAAPAIAVERSPGATPLPDGTFALPLVGEPPEWATSGVFERAVEAAQHGLAWDFAAGQAVVPVSAPSQLLIRPGVQIFPESIFPGWCTAAFVFDGGTRIATAGHCTRKGDRVLALTAPTTVLAMGTTVASTAGGSKLGSDWALVSIDPGWRPFVDPATAWVGGPCGKSPKPAVPILKYAGHGAVYGTGGTPRIGLFDSVGAAGIFGDLPPGFTGIGPANFGDSGAPVLETTRSDAATVCVGGGAVGILTHIQVVAETVPTGFFFGTLITRVGGRLTDAAILP